jgi:PAT family beta-lactamase induction signal transducer AmpG
VPGSLALILADHLPWDTVFVVVAGFMAVGVCLTLAIDEGPVPPGAPKTLRAAVVEPFREFLSRKGVAGAILVLSFMFLYKFGDNMAVALQTVFYVDLGFSLTQIGSIAKFSSLTAAIVGGLLGGLIMIRLSINRALWLFGFVQIFSILGFAVLAEVGNNPWLLGVTVAFEYLGVGLGTAAFIAFIARETNPAYAATQFALFTALASTPRTLASSVSGVIVEHTGWTSFFLLCFVLAIPGMLLLFKVAPWNER